MRSKLELLLINVSEPVKQTLTRGPEGSRGCPLNTVLTVFEIQFNSWVYLIQEFTKCFLIST